MVKRTQRITEDAHMLFHRAQWARQVDAHLLLALTAAQYAGSVHTIERIKKARTSAQGAVRHLNGLHCRAVHREK